MRFSDRVCCHSVQLFVRKLSTFKNIHLTDQIKVFDQTLHEASMRKGIIDCDILDP